MIIDILLVLFAIGGFWLGYAKGLARTLFNIAGYTIALFVTLWITPSVMSLMIRWFGAGKMFALVFGTLLCLILLILLITWLLRSVETYLKNSKFGSASKVGGGIVMMLVGIIVYGFVFWLITQFGWIGPKTTVKSYTYSVVSKIPTETGAFIGQFKPLFRRYWELTQQTIEESKAGTPDQ